MRNVFRERCGVSIVGPDAAVSRTLFVASVTRPFTIRCAKAIDDRWVGWVGRWMDGRIGVSRR